MICSCTAERTTRIWAVSVRKKMVSAEKGIEGRTRLTGCARQVHDQRLLLAVHLRERLGEVLRRGGEVVRAAIIGQVIGKLVESEFLAEEIGLQAGSEASEVRVSSIGSLRQDLL
jgi:hypothetical protein